MFDNSSPYSFAKKQTKILSSKGIPVWFNVGNKPKWYSNSLNRRKTDNTTNRRRKDNSTLYTNLKIDPVEPH